MPDIGQSVIVYQTKITVINYEFLFNKNKKTKYLRTIYLMWIYCIKLRLVIQHSSTFLVKYSLSQMKEITFSLMAKS